MTARRILIVEDNAHERGGHFPVMFAELASALTDAGCEVTVLTAQGWALHRERKAPPFELRQFGRAASLAVRCAERLARLPPRRYTRRVSAIGRDVAVVAAVRWARHQLGGADVISTSYRLDPYVTAASAGRGRWLVYIFRRPDETWIAGGRWFRGWQPRGAPPSRLLVALSRRSQNSRRRKGGDVRIAVNSATNQERWTAAAPWFSPVLLPFVACRDCLAIPDARALIGFEPGARLALLFGSLHPNKDHVVVWEAFERLPEWRLVIAGQGAAYAYRAWAQERGSTEMSPILLDGFVTEETRDLLYASADLVVLSFKAGADLDSGTLADAVSWGVPVVGSDRCFAGDLVRKLGIGLLFESGDQQSLAYAVRSCPSNLSDETLRLARDEMSARRMATKHLEALGDAPTSPQSPVGVHALAARLWEPGVVMFASQVRRIARRFGIDIRRHTVPKDDLDTVVALIAAHDIDLVLDVGANVGQYASGLRQRGYTGRIVSYEPLSTAHTLLANAAASDPAWEVAPRLALGARAGRAIINVSANSVSSSLLAMGSTHLRAAPGSAYVESEEVDVSRLDERLSDLADAQRIFLKIDTQGYESEVIEGSKGILDRVVGVQAELSLTTLYEGQSAWIPLLSLLDDLGFEAWAILRGFTEKSTGRMLQVDGVFFRSGDCA